MAFRYTNAGDGADFLTTVTALDVDKTKSLTGKAFYGSTSRTANFSTPAGIKEIWFKFDLFIDSAAAKGDRFSFGHYSSALGGYAGIWNGASNPAIFLCDAKPATALDTGLTATLGKINRVLLHMVSDATDGLIELTVNDASYTYTGNVNGGADFDTLYFYSSGANMLYSNIIVADSEIHGYEGMNSTEFDLETQISYGLRGWRYFNPGDADLLATGGTTQTVTTDKSVTGIAFKNTTTADLFNTPAGLKEVYMRFDFWCQSSSMTTWHFYAGCWSSSRSTIIGMHYRNLEYRCYLSDGSSDCGSLYQNIEQLNHVLLHIKSDATDGLIEFTLNGKTISWRGNVNDGADLDRLGMRANDRNYEVLFSNIIVSESAIDLNAGYHRQLIPTETAVTAPVLNVRWQGANHQFYPTTKRTTPALTLRVGDKNFYAPIVNNNDALASAVRLLLDDTNRALKT